MLTPVELEMETSIDKQDATIIRTDASGICMSLWTAELAYRLNDIIT